MCIKVAERQSVQCRAVRLCSNPESQMFRTVMLILSVLVSAIACRRKAERAVHCGRRPESLDRTPETKRSDDHAES